MKQLPEALQVIPLLALVFAFALLGAQELTFARARAARGDKSKKTKKKLQDMQG